MASNTDQFAVIGVGASAGGLAALSALLSALPGEANLAMVVIQHLDPRSESHLTPLLAARTKLKVVEATHGAKLAPRHVYVIQPNTDVAVTDGLLSVTARQGEHRPHYPIDHFFRSLASVHGPHAVGVILSGTGSDGTLGLAEISAAGGLTFAQDKSAEYPGMPNSAVAAGAVDLVLPPAEIAAHLAALPTHPYLAMPRGLRDDLARDNADFKRILSALRESSGVDFGQYRDTTIRRRTARRMLLRGIASMADYAALLEGDRDEVSALYRDVLINVTSFFRDPELFEDLKRDVFPGILETKADPQPIRVWVPGCSTGQEAYSVAIVLLEFLEAANVHRRVQIFATDLGDPVNLEKGRAGIYPRNIEAEISTDRLRRYFTQEGDNYRVIKAIREMCVFARQNITVDPPFSRVDLITCRNVLIYMSPALQKRLLPVFHFALNPGGYLVLGPSETVGHFGDLFELVNRVHKIHRKKDSAGRTSLTFMADDRRLSAEAGRAAATPVVHSDFHREADRVVLGTYSPPSVLVNHEGDIQQFRGRTAAFLEAPAGQPTTNVLRMASNDVFLPLRDALQEAKRTGAGVTRPGLRVTHASREIGFTLRVIPVTPAHAREAWWLVIFDAGAELVDHAESGDTPSSTGRDLTQLRQELASSRNDLQSMLDQHDSAAQDLRAAHEELLSSNEELQSTNEELETAKEELQSSNEELTSINDMLQRRNLDLDQLTNELSNFISSARLPIVTVGPDLRIRRLTPAAESVFNLLPTDVGRSLEHIKFSIDVERPGQAIRTVITTGQAWEQDGRDAEGRWWLLRVQPFLTAEGRADGATIVALDIDAVKRAREMTEARDYAIAVLQTVREPLVVLGEQLRVGLANQAFHELCGATAEQIHGRLFYDTCDGIWNDEEVRSALQGARSGDAPLVDFEIVRKIAGRGFRTLLLNARNIVRHGHETLLLLAVEDVTDRRQAEALRIDTETLRLMNKRKDEFLGVLAHELRNPLAPMRFALEVLHRGEADPNVAVQARQVLARQLDHMVRIVEDLLDVARITHGKVGVHRTPVDIRQVIASAVELCQPVIDAAGHTVTVSLPDNGGGLVGDTIRLTQVVVNLLNNAVKFTPPAGRVQVAVERYEDHAEFPNQMRISVRDSGIGIDSDTLPRIFDMFVQGDSSLEGSHAGLGVGLTLVRNLVELHGGTVDVFSEGPGTGCEFVVMLPIDPTVLPAAPASLPPAPQAPPLRILVADDYADSREMLAFLLERQGHTVAIAADGPSAIAVAADFEPDVAILDIGMPGASGYTVAQELRRRRGDGVALVALSGLGEPGDKARSASAGFDRHFTKPIDINVLSTFLAGLERP